MVKSLNNIWTYIGIIFVFAIFMLILKTQGGFLTEQNANGVITLPILENYSRYALGLNASEDELTDPISYKFNTTEGTEKDYSIPFLFSQEKSTTLRGKVNDIYTIPSKFVAIFGLPTDNFAPLIDLVSWLLSIGMIIALVYFMRGVLA